MKLKTSALLLIPLLSLVSCGSSSMKTLESGSSLYVYSVTTRVFNYESYRSEIVTSAAVPYSVHVLLYPHAYSRISYGYEASYFNVEVKFDSDAVDALFASSATVVLSSGASAVLVGGDAILPAYVDESYSFNGSVAFEVRPS